MTEPTPPPSLEEQAAQMKAQAEQMRQHVKAAFANARQLGTPVAYRQALEYIRSVQDSLEEYVALAVTMKGALTRGASATKGAYDEAWQQAVDQDGKSSVHRDMEGPRERYARHDLAVFTELRQWRQAEQRLALAHEMVDEMLLRYRAVNATREDIHTILRAFNVEVSLERT